MNGRLGAVGTLVTVVASAWVLGCGGGGAQGGSGGSGQGGAVATGGQAGASSTGGRGGATSAGGAGGGASCAPCYVAIVNRIDCSPSPTATCVDQKSQTTSAGGTITTNDNKCYSDGSKNLQRQTIGGADAGIEGTEFVAVQVFKNGAACASGDISYAGTLSEETATEVLKDGAGNLLATLVIVVTRTDGGDVVETKTVTCPGQAPQPLGTCPSSSSSVLCTAGSCS